MQVHIDAYQAEDAAKAARCHLLEPDELQAIWSCICLGEYISPDSHNIEITKPSLITCKVINCFKNHPYHSTLINDQAKETTNKALQQELTTAEAASLVQEQSMASHSEALSTQQHQLAASANVLWYAYFFLFLLPFLTTCNVQSPPKVLRLLPQLLHLRHLKVSLCFALLSY